MGQAFNKPLIIKDFNIKDFFIRDKKFDESGFINLSQRYSKNVASLEGLRFQVVQQYSTSFSFIRT